MQNLATRADGSRHLLSALSERAAQVITNSDGTAWPYTSVPTSTRMVARRLAELSRDLIQTALSAMQCVPGDGQPAADGDVVSILRAYERDGGNQLMRTAEASVAFAGHVSRTVATFIHDAEEMLEGRKSIDGTEIKRSPLYDK